MFASNKRRRVRPSMKSLGLSVLVCPVALYFAFLVFVGYYLFLPLVAAFLVATAAVWIRNRGLRVGLPEPYGKGKVSTMDAKRAARQGLFAILVGALATVGLLGSVYFLPPVVFYTLVFGLAAGLPLNEIAFFVLVMGLERRSESRIFVVTEEIDEGEGRSALVKTFSMGRSHRSGSSPAASD